MPELTIFVLSKGTSQSFSKPEVHLGRDPSCDLVFPSAEFPMVGRHHALLRETAGAWSVEDLQSTNGTFVNQVQVQRQELAPGDTLRLGSDGPEVRVQFVAEASMPAAPPAALAAAAGAAVTQPSAARSTDQPAVPPAEQNATPAAVGAQLAPTKHSEPPPTRPAAPTPQSVGPTKPSPARFSAPAKTIRTAPEQEQIAQPEVSPPVAAPQQQAEISQLEVSSAVAAPQQQAEISQLEEEDPMNEEKLSLLRNLVLVMVALVVVLVGIVISQTQDIRRDLKNMHDEATKVVVGGMDKKIQQVQDDFGKTMDQKIERANSQLSDTMDQKMQDAQAKFSKSIHESMQQEENHMMNRLKNDLPGIIDEEVERQKRKILQ